MTTLWTHQKPFVTYFGTEYEQRTGQQILNNALKPSKNMAKETMTEEQGEA